jgi:hypothetical protein
LTPTGAAEPKLGLQAKQKDAEQKKRPEAFQ